MDVYHYATKGVYAKGHPKGSGFLILADSEASGGVVNSCPQNVQEFRAQLVNAGTLQSKGGSKDMTFTEDVFCYTSSFAACLVGGNSRNGLQSWRNAANEYLRDAGYE